MSTRFATVDSGIRTGFIVSTALHLAVFLLVVWLGKPLPENRSIQETYYVDIVNMPVSAPQVGSPTQRGEAVEPAPAPPPLPARPMTLPKAAAPGRKAPAPAEKPLAPAEDSTTDSSFAERMAKIQKSAEARQEEAALERLRGKVKATPSGRSGMPAAGGKEQGSDYTAYIQSRLKDAFRETISYSSKNPEMIMRLFIDSSGRLTRRVIERSSGDRAFELAVLRAVDNASEKFHPPPNRTIFEGVFVFKPQGITPDRGK